LKTGTYYKMILKRFANGYLRPATEQNISTDPYTYVIVDKEAKDNVDYKSGGSGYNTIQFYFTPSNVSGWYLLHHVDLYATWSKISPNSEPVNNETIYVVMQKRTDQKSDYGPPEEPSWFLWKPVASGEPGKYRIVSKDYPDDFVTWTTDKFGNMGYFLQIEHSTDAEYRKKYDKGNEWWLDSLFCFE